MTKALVVLLGGCVAASSATPPPPPTNTLGSFAPVPAATPLAPPGADEIFAGTVEKPGAELDARRQVRKLSFPHPPRGSSQTFNFGENQRGWVAALPNAQLLPTPAFGGGKIFVSGGFASRTMYAFDARDGHPLWTAPAKDGGPSAAIYYEDKVIFNAESCEIFVADAATGKLLWQKWLGDPLMSQPVAVDDKVMTAYPANGAHIFAAYKLTSGAPLWQVPVGADVIRVPEVSGDSVYFATMDGVVRRVRHADGTVVWMADIGATSVPAVDGDRVLITRRVDGEKVREQPIVLSAKDGSVQSEGVMREAAYLDGGSRDRNLLHQQAGAWGTVPSGARLGLTNVAAGWAFQGSSAMIADGRAYTAVGGDLLATEIKSGRESWRHSYRQGKGAQGITPPAVAGSQLVFGTIDGHLYVADIDTGMTSFAYDLGEAVMYQPIVAEGWVYVTTAKGNLVALELGDSRLDGWHMWGGNAQHTGVVENVSYSAKPEERPTQGTLRSEGAQLPLLKTEAEVRISGFVAEVTLRQEFFNPNHDPVEGVYLFPLPDDAAVDEMEMHIGDRVVRAVIKKKEEAAATYAEAKGEGKRAALLEQQRNDLFVQKVANIPGNEKIDVVIRYVHWLPFADGQYEYRLPMVAPPAFDPKDLTAVLGKPGELRAANEVALTVTLNAGGLPVENLHSPSHDVGIQRKDGNVVVRLADSERIPNRDFVLRYGLAGETPRATVLSANGYFSLVVQPPAAPAEAQIGARELTFVVDTSSSMRGRPLEQAREIIAKTLDGARPDDTFDVYHFSDKAASFGRTPVSAASVAAAKKALSNLRATGGTDMVPAIEAALGEPADPGRTRIVVLVTDGYIANEADVLRSIAGRLGGARIYTVGVGASVNRFLLERASEIGRGRSLQVVLSEPPEQAAARLGRLIDRPVFTDLRIDWGGLEVSELYPRRLPDLFASSPLVVRGRWRKPGKATVRVSGNIGAQRYERAIAVELKDDGHSAQRVLWARAAVHDRMNRLTLKDDDELIAEVTELGLDHHLVTPWTSLVAVDDTPKTVTAQNQKIEAIAPEEGPEPPLWCLLAAALVIYGLRSSRIKLC
jgi:Ca-activated chloride channel family protein